MFSDRTGHCYFSDRRDYRNFILQIKPVSVTIIRNIPYIRINYKNNYGHSMYTYIRPSVELSSDKVSKNFENVQVPVK